MSNYSNVNYKKTKGLKWFFGFACLFCFLSSIVNTIIYLLYGEIISFIGAVVYAICVPISIFGYRKNYTKLKLQN